MGQGRCEEGWRVGGSKGRMGGREQREGSRGGKEEAMILGRERERQWRKGGLREGGLMEGTNEEGTERGTNSARERGEGGIERGREGARV